MNISNSQSERESHRLQELALDLFLEKSRWVAGASISRSGIGDSIVHMLVDVSPRGHDLIRDHGMQAIEQKIQAELSSKDLQGTCWTFRSGHEDVWGRVEPGVQQKFPRVVSRIDDFPQHRLLIDISPELDCFKGHFPGNPILPGVTQLHWAVCVSRFIYGFNEVPGEVKRLKFRNIIAPPRIVELALNNIHQNEVQFEFASLGQIHSQGCLVFDGELAC